MSKYESHFLDTDQSLHKTAYVLQNVTNYVQPKQFQCTIQKFSILDHAGAASDDNIAIRTFPFQCILPPKIRWRYLISDANTKTSFKMADQILRELSALQEWINWLILGRANGSDTKRVEAGSLCNLSQTSNRHPISSVEVMRCNV